MQLPTSVIGPIPVDWVKALDKKVQMLPPPMLEAHPELNELVEKGRELLKTPSPDKEACQALFMQIAQARP